MDKYYYWQENLYNARGELHSILIIGPYRTEKAAKKAQLTGAYWNTQISKTIRPVPDGPTIFDFKKGTLL